jgi:hypothetical protein
MEDMKNNNTRRKTFLPVITTPVSGPEVGRGEGVVLAGAGVATGPTSLKHLCLHSV